VLRRLLRLLVLHRTGEADKNIELVVLCHQIAVPRRQVTQPTFHPADRAFMPPQAGSCRGSAGVPSWSRRRPCSGGTASSSPGSGQSRTAPRSPWSFRPGGPPTYFRALATSEQTPRRPADDGGRARGEPRPSGRDAQPEGAGVRWSSPLRGVERQPHPPGSGDFRRSNG